MKKITNYLKSICLAVAFMAAINTQAQNCAANFTWTNQANGGVTFTSTSVFSNTATTVTYYWNFGNSTTYSATGWSGASTNTTYSVNGTYVVTLFILSTSPTCSAGIQYTITISNAGGCALNSNFNYSQGSNGLVNFNNTSTGTNGGTTYSWNFGDNSGLSTSTSPAHTFSANGAYTVTLVSTNSSTCISTKTLVVNVTSYCNVNASFTSTNSANGLVLFTSTSTGTLSGYIHHWIFGDGGQTWGGPSTAHTYTNGTYTAYLVVSNSSVNPTCKDTAQMTISVTNNTCNLTASFTQTIGANGAVNFNSTTTGTTSNTTYTWNFGNGFTSNSANPSVTYANAGIYYVYLITKNASNCISTTGHTINVNTIPCVANANFTLVPTNTPQYWTAIPAYPWNVSNATWNWGDNSSTSFSLYASHQYSAAGLYTICLTVTVNCGATASVCTSYSVFKTSQSQAIIHINVEPPPLQSVDGNVPTGISSNENVASGISVFPNPNTGSFTLRLNDLEAGKTLVQVYNLVGEIVYSTEEDRLAGNSVQKIQLDNAAKGIYFLKVSNNNKSFTQKIVLEK